MEHEKTNNIEHHFGWIGNQTFHMECVFIVIADDCALHRPVWQICQAFLKVSGNALNAWHVN